MDDEWTCPICGKKISMGIVGYYSYGNDARIEALEGQVEGLNDVITHLIVKHLMGAS